MTSTRAVRSALLACLAATGLAACGSGSDGVASPGEGSFVPSPPVAPPVAPPVSPPVSPPSGPAASCPGGFTNAGVIANLRNCQLPSLITGTLNVPKLAGVVYSVTSVVDVGQDRGGDPANPIGGALAGTLSIDPGVTIFGSGGLDFIRVNRGSQIQAVGTVAEPIIFTSRQDVENASLADEAPGAQWGGLLVLGRAPINDGCPVGQPQSTTAPVNCQLLAEATNALYGGISATDTSGRISHAIIKYPGFTVTTNKELNGLTMAGVGNGTVVENVQVHQSSDDGVELFGGTVNLKNIVLTGNDDDSFDTDLGWRGAAQYMIVVQRTSGGDRGFEWSAHESTVTPPFTTADPLTREVVYRSQPRVSNVTMVMRSNATPANTVAVLENLGTQGFIWNSIFVRPDNLVAASACLDIDTDYTLNGGGQTFRSVLFSCGANPFLNDTGSGVDGAQAQAQFTHASNNANYTSTLVGRNGSPAFINGATENGTAVTAPVNSGAANGVVSTFLTTPTNIGAVHTGNDTWYQGWTCSPMIGEESC